MKTEKEIILKVENLCQYFKSGNYINKAVDDVSFDICKGEAVGLVGESGCGKTTTGRAIIKLYDCTSGNVYLKGKRICAGVGNYKQAIKDAKVADLPKPEIKRIVKEQSELIKQAKIDHKRGDKAFAREQAAKVDADFAPQLEEARAKVANTPKDSPDYMKALDEQKALMTDYRTSRRSASKEKFITKIQMIFQDPTACLNPRMIVRDIVAEGLIIKGVRDKEYIDKKVFEALRLVGLMPEHANRYQHEFSGGQRQRIGIARALIMNPELLIADEPISALDVSIQAQVITLLNELRENIGLTILFIAHNLSVIRYFCDRIAVMYYGKLMEVASTEELFSRPIHPYTRSLLSAVPYPDPLLEKQRKRIIYNPLLVHDYSVSKPKLVEITPRHFVYCNEEELQQYKKEFSI